MVAVGIQTVLQIDLRMSASSNYRPIHQSLIQLNKYGAGYGNAPETRGLLVNSAFKNDEDIVDSVCEAWNTFTESSERVTEMCSRDYGNMLC